MDVDKPRTVMSCPTRSMEAASAGRVDGVSEPAESLVMQEATLNWIPGVQALASSANSNSGIAWILARALLPIADHLLRHGSAPESAAVLNGPRRRTASATP